MLPHMPTVRPILTYPGGKSKAIKSILPHIPMDARVLVSPFVGGGSVEIAFAARHPDNQVHAGDNFMPLVTFWQVALREAPALAAQVESWLPRMDKHVFRSMQLALRNNSLDSDMEVAKTFFIVNRCSFAGSTLSGGMSSQWMRRGHFTPRMVERLRDFHVPNMQVTQADFVNTLQRHPQAFAYLDPPYALDKGNNLYGFRGSHHRDFNHDALADILCQRDQWVLSYNDCEYVRDTYAAYDIIRPQWNYHMHSTRKSREVLIVNP